ncbi:hypothetical protein F1880_004013 [Penicillium rolfsii]|nr:hypothetical protein F1880_004013 [Penicillium rolfsii]
MPHIRHHRRHHSWPYCGSELCMRQPPSLELRIPRPGDGSSNVTPWTFQQATIPLIAEEFDDDDAEMAGIVRSRTPRVHRLWARTLLRNEREEIHLSATAVDARKHVHRSVLRRLIRRPLLDRTRSLFVMPTTRRAGDGTTISGWMPARLLAQPVTVMERNRTALAGIDTVKLPTERRHRRSHSEQPRSWREPSASLWPLREESP